MKESILIDQQIVDILLNLIQDSNISGHAELNNDHTFHYNFIIRQSGLHPIEFIHENYFEKKPNIHVALKFYLTFKTYHMMECYIGEKEEGETIPNFTRSRYDCTRHILLNQTDFNKFKDLIFMRQNQEFNQRSQTAFQDFITNMKVYLDENKIINNIDDL